MRPTANRFSSLADFALKTTSASEWMTAHLTQPDSPVSTNYQSSCRRDMAIVAKQRLPETIRAECEATVEKQPTALTSSELSESKEREMQRTGSRKETRQLRTFRGVVTAGKRRGEKDDRNGLQHARWRHNTQLSTTGLVSSLSSRL